MVEPSASPAGATCLPRPFIRPSVTMADPSSPRRRALRARAAGDALARSERAPRALAATATHATTKKNIVYLVTDDQDQMLGSSFPETLGATPLAKTKALLVDQGVTFSNAFIHVPICDELRPF